MRPDNSSNMFLFTCRSCVLVWLVLLIALPASAEQSAEENAERNADEFRGRQHVHQPLSRIMREDRAQESDSDSQKNKFNSYLHQILRVRVPGTVGHREVQAFLVKSLVDAGWDVAWDNFTAPSPIGKKNFSSVIATLDGGRSDKHLALVAHYDSKLMTPRAGQYFLAATDSAVPIAMLLEVARVIGKEFKESLKKNPNPEIAPKIILLDGEEAFIEWTPDDSIYGARHLADLWSHTPHHKPIHASRSINMLDSLEAFVLLDLIGEEKPLFYDMHTDTSHLYKMFQNIEEEHSKCSRMFVGKMRGPVGIEDDHTPFLQKGVRILHLIPIPFPRTWHTLDDDHQHLDFPTINCLRKLLRIFVLEYFHLGERTST